MSRNKKGRPRTANDQAPRRPAPLLWSFDRSIPTEDFFEGKDLTGDWALGEAIEGFIFYLEQDRFLTWEAVVAEEQGLPLTSAQRAALGDLLDFGDGDDEGILYIDDMARPSEPWHAILNRIAPHLLIEPLRTSDLLEETRLEGWANLCEALEEHGQELSLPEGAQAPLEVVPVALRYRLWLQDIVVESLYGLGQDPGSTLKGPEEHWRVDEFVQLLAADPRAVAVLGLSVKRLLDLVVLPEADQPIFCGLMLQRLGLTSTEQAIAPVLGKGPLDPGPVSVAGASR